MPAPRYFWLFEPHSLPEVTGPANARPCALAGYRKVWGRVPVSSPLERYVRVDTFEPYTWVGEGFVEPNLQSLATGVALRLEEQSLVALDERHPTSTRVVVSEHVTDWNGRPFDEPVVAYVPTDRRPPEVVGLPYRNRGLELAAAWNAVAPGFSESFARELELCPALGEGLVGRVSWAPDYCTLWLSQDGLDGRVCLVRICTPLQPSRLAAEFTLEWASKTTQGWEEWEARTPLSKLPKPTSLVPAALQQIRRGQDLAALASHPCWLVRLAVAGNAKVGPDVTPNLVKDADPWVQAVMRAVLRARLRA